MKNNLLLTELLDAPNWKTFEEVAPKVKPPVAGLSIPSKVGWTGLDPKTGDITEAPNAGVGFWDSALSVLLVKVKLAGFPNERLGARETALVGFGVSLLAPNTKLDAVETNAVAEFWGVVPWAVFSLFPNTKGEDVPRVGAVLLAGWLPNWNAVPVGCGAWNAENVDALDAVSVGAKKKLNMLFKQQNKWQ